MIVLNVVFASQYHTEVKIYSMVLTKLFANHTVIKLWTDNPKAYGLFHHLSIPVILMNKPEKADLLVLYRTENIRVDRPIFAASYRILRHYHRSDRSIGGFYWQKGRPNLIFYERALKRYRLILPKIFERYKEHE